MYLIVSADCIGFDHILIILFILFYIQIFSYIWGKYVNKRSVFSIQYEDSG